MNCKFTTKQGFSKQPMHQSRKVVGFFEKEIIPFSKIIQTSIIGDEATCAGRWKYAAIDKFVLIDQEYNRGMQLSVENWKL